MSTPSTKEMVDKFEEKTKVGAENVVAGFGAILVACLVSLSLMFMTFLHVYIVFVNVYFPPLVFCSSCTFAPLVLLLLFTSITTTFT